MVKAEPWEKPYYKKKFFYSFSVHNIQREENKDIKKCLRRLDNKRKWNYFKGLRDAMPKDFNTVELQEQEEHFVLKEMQEIMDAQDEYWRGVAAENAHMYHVDAEDASDAEDPADDALAADGDGDWDVE